MQLWILGWHNQVSRVGATLPAPSSRRPAAEVYCLRVSTLFSLILCVISSHTLTLFNSFVILNNLKCCENIGALMFACKKKKRLKLSNMICVKVRLSIYSNEVHDLNPSQPPGLFLSEFDMFPLPEGVNVLSCVSAP